MGSGGGWLFLLHNAIYGSAGNEETDIPGSDLPDRVRNKRMEYEGEYIENRVI